MLKWADATTQNWSSRVLCMCACVHVCVCVCDFKAVAFSLFEEYPDSSENLIKVMNLLLRKKLIIPTVRSHVPRWWS